MNQVGRSIRCPSVRRSPDLEVLRLRSVHRAAADLRRGTPVVLTGDAPLILLAAETAGPRGLAELAALAAEPPVLLLAPMRAAAVLHQPVDRESPVVALHVSSELLTPELLRGLADPTASELLPTQPEPALVPELAASALILAKLAGCCLRCWRRRCVATAVPTCRGSVCSACRPPT